MTSCEVPCADRYCQVDRNQHSKFAAIKVKNGNKWNKTVMMINTVMGWYLFVVHFNTSSVSMRRQCQMVRGLVEHKLNQCGRKSWWSQLLSLNRPERAGEIRGKPMLWLLVLRPSFEGGVSRIHVASVIFRVRSMFIWPLRALNWLASQHSLEAAQRVLLNELFRLKARNCLLYRSMFRETLC